MHEEDYFAYCTDTTCGSSAKPRPLKNQYFFLKSLHRIFHREIFDHSICPLATGRALEKRERV